MKKKYIQPRILIQGASLQSAVQAVSNYYDESADKDSPVLVRKRGTRIVEDDDDLFLDLLEETLAQNETNGWEDGLW